MFSLKNTKKRKIKWRIYKNDIDQGDQKKDLTLLSETSSIKGFENNKKRRTSIKKVEAVERDPIFINVFQEALKEQERHDKFCEKKLQDIQAVRVKFSKRIREG